MKALLIIVIYSILLSLSMSHEVQAEKTAKRALPLPEHVNFQLHILPVLQTKCSPCHFSGGKMYERMPFDQQLTIQKHGPGMAKQLKDNDRLLLEKFIGQSIKK